MRQTFSNLVFYLLIMVLILSGVSGYQVYFQVSKFPNYQKVVNDNIARYGGLTAPAMEKINKQSRLYGENRFSIISDEMGVKKGYGEIITYQIKQDYEVNLIINKKITQYTEGSATSEVR